MHFIHKNQYFILAFRYQQNRLRGGTLKVVEDQGNCQTGILNNNLTLTGRVA